ncbi:hypothetical protein GH733_003105 [Mirounga leonina]|nr:hypothetical protein GH733_003105 [Mirounga leonina]
MQQSTGSAPLSLHCSGCGPLSPDHTGSRLAISHSIVTSGPLAPSPQTRLALEAPFWFRWYREHCPDGVYSRMTTGRSHGRGTLRCPQRKGKLWTGGDVLGLDSCWWFSAKEQRKGCRGGEESDSMECRLSENVVNRMKDSSQSCQAGQPASPPAPPPSTFGTSKGPEKDSKLPKSEYGGGRQSSKMEEDFLKRYKQEQAKVQDELFQVVTREREAATKHRSASLQQGEGSVDQEKQKSTQLFLER